MQETELILSNTLGTIFRITTWGESHGKAVGVVVDGCPAGLVLSEKDIQRELDRRRPGQSKVTTKRQEEDKVEILSGLFEGKTLGSPLSILVWNRDVQLKDYERLKDIYRPGHADFTYEAKYGRRDWRGGGRASARETVGRVAGGAVAKRILHSAGVGIVGFVKQIGNIKFSDTRNKIQTDFKTAIEKSIVRCPDPRVSKRMIELIEEVRRAGDSVGGVIEAVAVGVPAGWGEPVFDKLSADLAKALMSIPGVKGAEIGSGFGCVNMRGSEHNDELLKLRIGAKTNNAGGILGGISNGMPIVARIAVKPTSSITKEQQTINQAGQRQKIKITGRHDPCLCPRVVPVAEAMMALVLADHYLLNRVSRI